MNRSEENFFESNAEFLLMGDKQLTDNFRLGFTVEPILCIKNLKHWEQV